MTDDDGFTPIDSSFLSHHKYDADSRLLTVKMHNGSVYEHPGVPADKFEAFSGADSPGLFYNRKIKHHHPGRKV